MKGSIKPDLKKTCSPFILLFGDMIRRNALVVSICCLSICIKKHLRVVSDILAAEPRFGYTDHQLD